MTNGQATDLMYEVFLLSFKIGGPILIISMIVGVIISIIQAATQINEQTLTFVPKLIAIAIVLIVMGGTMLNGIQDFTVRIFEMMAG